MSTEETAPAPIADLAAFIRDPAVTWYGPNQCNKCGRFIVKSSHETGGVELNAEDFNHHYPNFAWTQHKCDPADVAMNPSTVTPEVAEMAARLNQSPTAATN